MQRVLGARSLKDGQNGALFAGFLKITPVFLMVLPGVIGYVLWQKGAIALANVPGTSTPDYNTMLPVLINHLVPIGLRGLLAACMAAALMSCMAAALNSCATLVSMDVVKRVRPDTPDARVVRIGRITTGVIMVLAMLWSTQGDQFGTIFEAINKIPMTFAPAVTTVFVLGLLWKRGTKQAAMATLYAGSLLGVVYFLADLPRIGRLVLGGRAPRGLRRPRHRSRGRPGHPVHARRPAAGGRLRRDLRRDEPADPGHGRHAGRGRLLGPPAGVPPRSAGRGERPAPRVARASGRRRLALLLASLGLGAPMKRNPLGRTGLQVSRLSFGASSLGGVFRTVDEGEAVRAVHAALDAGINYVDVAPAYGATRAETVLGRALREVPRARYFLSTKVGKYTNPGAYGDDTLDYSRARIRASLDESARPPRRRVLRHRPPPRHRVPGP